ncbi:MAG TPA: hypothetical protein VKU02_06345 [Gemmataceae bacterium]|nr:hypothetical protein [Gemmataceae bacterium]
MKASGNDTDTASLLLRVPKQASWQQHRLRWADARTQLALDQRANG